MDEKDFILLVEEAILYARLNKKTINGEKITKQSLGKNISVWKEKNSKSINANIHNLSKGHTGKKFVRIIREICELTGVDANFLFQIKPMDDESK